MNSQTIHLVLSEWTGIPVSELKASERLPLFQMIGKNVGIRRSRAPFVLATNVDIIFSDALFSFLAETKDVPLPQYGSNTIPSLSFYPK